ncbi:hypothetical protein WEB32_13270 [Streptomyces netropsis]|uniref:Uncharacterized protein n=1 Tax=Streptomyces netropsis TaxID=55404 RepID=A0A7W7LJE1_STRNE|nr:hypothetical protein [Streptomyces netropsis]MBB4890641.1 hypothetical protein [Streptomyces netropsis]GGR49414.1 hypothetical protein GCM10010219_63460 [Streptomyces netropsis]
MSAPPPYQYQPPHQPMHQPQPPSPQRSPLRGLITALVMLAVFGGVGWYVWDYNTDPNGGKAKKEADRVARVEEAKEHNPKIGDCVKVQDPHGKPVPTIVDCGSPEAEYKTGAILYGPDKKCGAEYQYGIQYSGRRTVDNTMCFTKL